MSKGNLFVISGASGVGKNTVLKELMARRDDLLFSVSATTRPPREGEQEAVSYYFVSHDTFRQMIREDAFVEYDDHMDNYYGTPRAQLEDKLSRANVILDIEPNGAFRVRSQRPDATLIFITPPSVEELERRLRSRGDTPEEQIRLRLDRAAWEIAQGEKYDYVVVNDRVEACVDAIMKIIAERAD
ncbi:MAG: guanylate kinase [Oscillospiraceae bacterium]|nr:guanylate kinase [Oscillospiraceae bacterium]